MMRDALFLVFSLLSVCSAFSALSVSIFAYRRGGQPWLGRWIAWLAAAALFLIVRNTGVFMIRIAGVTGFEEIPAFGFVYLAAAAFFVYTLIRSQLQLLFPQQERCARVWALIPVLPIALNALALLLSLLLPSLGISVSILRLINMIFLYLVIALVMALVLIRLGKVSDKERRQLLLAALGSGLLHLVLSLVKGVLDLSHSRIPQVLSVANGSLLFLFVATIIIVGRKNLAPRWVPPSFVIRKSIAGLTAREIDLVMLIARGVSNSDASAELGISVSSVKNTLFRLYRKYGVSSRSELLLALGIDGKRLQETPTGTWE